MLKITESMAKKNGLKYDYGVLIQRGESREDLAVVPGSATDKAGLVENDIILEFDGMKLDGKRSLSLLTREKNVGDKVKLKIVNGGQERDIELELGRAPRINDRK